MNAIQKPESERIFDRGRAAREKNEWRELCRAEINKNDPNRLSDIICRVNEMVEERKAKLSKKTKSAAAGKRK